MNPPFWDIVISTFLGTLPILLVVLGFTINQRWSRRKFKLNSLR